MAMNSSNIFVKTITNMGIYGLHSVMGANRDKCDCTFLTKDECQTTINYLCTN